MNRAPSSFFGKSFAILRSICLTFALCAAMVAGSPAQTFTTLTNIPGYDQFSVFSPLIQGTDGNFYGTALDFSGGYGSVYRVAATGTLTILYNFCTQPNCTDGAEPTTNPLVLGTDGNFYGVTYYGGATCASSGIGLGCGTVFKMTPSGVLTVLHSFDGTDGNNPTWLIQSSGGNFFGTASNGGSGSICVDGCGTIFKMTPHGTVTTLHSFNFSDGWIPTGLVQATDGKLYGTTTYGGANYAFICGPYGLQYNCGTVFKITTGGVFTLLHSFAATDGANPYVPPVQASNGNFYGTTLYFQYGNGSIYRITPRGTLSVMDWWKGTTGNPTVGLVQASDGDLYGTVDSSPCSTGSVYKISVAGAYTTEYYSCSLGTNSGLLQATDGKFYGTYTNGGNYIYSLDVGLGPFVAFVQPSGGVGKTAQILGQGLTGTTNVTFNGLAASSFKVVSDTYMTAVVPFGATTGPVVVTTPSGTLTSNKNFQITQ